MRTLDGAGPAGFGTAPESHDAATVLLDAEGVITSWSEGAERLLGHRSDEVLGHPVTTLLATGDPADLRTLAARCRATGQWSGVLTARHREGRRTVVAVRVATLIPRTGPACWAVMGTEAFPEAGLGLSRDVLEAMVTHSPVGIAVVDTDLRFVWSNAALSRFGGGPPEHRLGRRLAEIQPDLHAAGLEEQMRQVLRSGVPVMDYEHVGRPRSDPHRRHAHSMSFYRIDDGLGRPLGVYYTVIDITDRYRAVQRLSLLDEASERIGRTLDVMRTAQDLADVAVPGLADFVAVDLLESVVRGVEPSPGPLLDADAVPLRRGGQQSVRTGLPESVVTTGQTARYQPWSPPVHSLTSGTSWRAGTLDPAAPEWAADLPGEGAARLRELGFHSAMAVPIRARGITMGVTTFFREQRVEGFEEDDLSLAEELVSRAAVCIDNARRYTREREATEVLQGSLLPHDVPEQEAVEVATWYRPADELVGVGGDWVDVLPLSGARVALVAGDVVGHGIEAAAVMGRLRTAVHTLADLDLPPQEVLAHLDDLVARMARTGGHGGSRSLSARALGTSCLYAVLDPVGLSCSAASAGHQPPAILAPDGRVRFPELPAGPALGVGGPPFESVEFTVEEGSVLALYTSGLLAAPPGGDTSQEAGRARLGRALERYGLPLERLGRAVIDELVSAQPADDVALMLAGVRRLDTRRVASWDLRADPAVVGQARELAAGRLADWGLDELVFTTELLVSELVTNAIRYASEPIQLRLIRANTLICEVSDGTSTSPHVRHPRTSDEGGRGLFLISQFAERWGTRYSAAEGKVIWAEQLLDGDAAAAPAG